MLITSFEGGGSVVGAAGVGAVLELAAFGVSTILD